MKIQHSYSANVPCAQIKKCQAQKCSEFCKYSQPHKQYVSPQFTQELQTEAVTHKTTDNSDSKSNPFRQPGASLPRDISVLPLNPDLSFGTLNTGVKLSLDTLQNRKQNCNLTPSQLRLYVVTHRKQQKYEGNIT